MRNPATQPRTGTTYESRQEKVAKLMRKEAALARALETESGLRKIAANMANPVRRQLDYKGIFRKFVVVEQMPDGVPLIYDRDLPKVPAVKVGGFGTARQIEMVGKRTELQPFEIVARPKIPYSELYNRRYRALDRAKDRLIEGVELKEDLIGFGMLEASANIGGTYGNTVQTTAGMLDRDVLAKTFTQIEQRRLVVNAVLMSPWGTQGIRRFQWQDLDQAGMQEVRESGYLGSYWGADFYVSDQVAAGAFYCLTTPKFLGWMPIRKDLDVIPADDPDNLRLGFVGYELLSLTVHNTWGVGKGTFNTAG